MKLFCTYSQQISRLVGAIALALGLAHVATLRGGTALEAATALHAEVARALPLGHAGNAVMVVGAAVGGEILGPIAGDGTGSRGSSSALLLTAAVTLLHLLLLVTTLS